MAVEFTLDNIIGIMAQTFFSGSVQMAGLAVLLACFFISFVIMAAIKAPVTYSLVPMIILDIIFTAYGILNTTVSFIIIIVCAILIAMQARQIVERG